MVLCPMFEFAKFYRRMGWSIIPQQRGAKKPLVKWKEFQSRLPTEDEISEWWLRWPDAGVCLILGSISGVVAVDSDSEIAHHVFVSRMGGIPPTLTVRSGSRKPGKFHYYFRSPEFPTAATFTPWHRQLEFRGTGGYIVVPPSLHASGLRYEWIDDTAAIMEMPPILLDGWRANRRFVRSIPQERSPVDRDYGSSATTLREVLLTPGLARSTTYWLQGVYANQEQWNSRLFSAACDMAGLGIPVELALPLLLSGARPNTNDDERIARSTITSAFSKERTPLRQFASEYAAPFSNLSSNLHRPPNTPIQ